ncbi:MAG: beta-eliminating lyase-related protein [Candidatus Bathyarchaeota archaeon]|nr:beta-eliminating lyase-related protein [Candidatus Bathyarchaeota archaeon]
MTAFKGAMPDKSLKYLEGVEEEYTCKSPREIAAMVNTLVEEHDDWRRNKCLNLNPSENAISPGARRLLDTDLATRVTEGFVGDKEYPPAPMNRYIDEIEGIIIYLVKRLFHCDYVEWRTLSSSMANSLVYFALSKSGDTIMSQSNKGGGNDSYRPNGPPGLRGLKVEDLPCSPLFDVDYDALDKSIMKVKPSWIVIGGGRVLFPYNLKRLREAADEVGARILYDAAHLGPLIAFGLFQDPLKEGADVMTLGTHKLMGGPIGGLALTNDEDLAKKMLALTHPAFLQTRDQNKYAAAAWSLCELAHFGSEYAKQIQANSKALAVALNEQGFNVVGSEKGYTKTHQVIVNVRDLEPRIIEKRLNESNILIPTTVIWDDSPDGRGGLRISVQEATRQGMCEGEMRQVASLVKRSTDGEDPISMRAEVERFVTPFRKLKYCF